MILKSGPALHGGRPVIEARMTQQQWGGPLPRHLTSLAASHPAGVQGAPVRPDPSRGNIRLGKGTRGEAQKNRDSMMVDIDGRTFQFQLHQRVFGPLPCFSSRASPQICGRSDV